MASPLQRPDVMMTKTRAAFLVIFLAALVGLAGCRSLMNIENPHYAIRDIRPRVSVAIPLSQSSIDFNFLVDVDNPNSVGLTLDRMDFDLMMNDRHLLSGVTDRSVRIPANGIGEVEIRGRVGYENIRNIFTEVVDLIQGQRAQYQLRGTAYYNTPLGQMRFPLTIYQSGR